MKPSVHEMIEASQQALKDFVAPTVSDPWAASALRSVDVILSHLLARVPAEGPALFEDNADLAAILASARAAELADAELRRLIDTFLAEQVELSGGYPAVTPLLELNVRGREIVDALLVLCHDRKGETGVGALHGELRAYLDRHLERERAYFFPVYVGRPL